MTLQPLSSPYIKSYLDPEALFKVSRVCRKTHTWSKELTTLAFHQKARPFKNPIPRRQGWLSYLWMKHSDRPPQVTKLPFEMLCREGRLLFGISNKGALSSFSLTTLEEKTIFFSPIPSFHPTIAKKEGGRIFLGDASGHLMIFLLGQKLKDETKELFFLDRKHAKGVHGLHIYNDYIITEEEGREELAISSLYNGDTLTTLRLDNPSTALAFYRKKNWLIIGSKRGVFSVWDCKNSRSLFADRLKGDAGITTLTIEQDVLIIGTTSGSVILFNIDEFKVLRQIAIKESPVKKVFFFSNTLFLLYEEGTFVRFNEEKKGFDPLKAHKVDLVASTEDLLITVGEGVIKIWDEQFNLKREFLLESLSIHNPLSLEAVMGSLVFQDREKDCEKTKVLSFHTTLCPLIAPPLDQLLKKKREQKTLTNTQLIALGLLPTLLKG